MIYLLVECNSGYEIPINIIECDSKKVESDLNRLQELSFKYKDDINEIIEFAKLYNKYINRKDKYE